MASTEIETNAEEGCKFHRICRLCLSEESLDDVFKEPGLQQWISDFLSIKVTTADRMSRAICEICRLRMTEFHQFRTRCQEVQNVLQSMIPDPNVVRLKKEPAMPQTSCESGQNGCVSSTSTNRNSLGNNAVIPTVQSTSNEVTEGKPCIIGNIQPNVDGIRQKVDTEQRKDTGSINGMHKPKVKTEPGAEMIDDSTVLRQARSHMVSIPVGLPLDAGYTHKGQSHTKVSQGKPTSEPPPVSTEEMIDIHEMKLEARTDDEQESYPDKSVSTLSEPNPSVDTDENTIDSGLRPVDERPPDYQDVEAVGEVRGLQCNVCLKEVASKQQLWRHKKAVHGPKNFICHICDLRFPSSQALLQHQQTKKHSKKLQEIHDAEPIRTEDHTVTDMSYELQPAAENGIYVPQIYEQQQPTVMEDVKPIVPEMYSHYSAYTAYINVPAQEIAAKPVKIRECDVCHKVFTCAKKFWAHKRYHGSKNYLCPICGKPFLNRFLLDRHIPIHDPKGSHRKSILQARQETRAGKMADDGARPFKCDICHKGFKMKDTVYGHKQKVHGPKIHGCHNCGAKFRTRDKLVRHLRRHSLEDSYQSEQVPQTETPTTLNNATDEATANNTSDVDSAVPPQTQSASTFRCAKCDTVCHSHAQLWKHFKHTHRKKHKCPTCRIEFVEKICFEKHMARHDLDKEHAFPQPNTDGSTDQQLKCHVCDKVYKTVMQFRLHMTVHKPKIYKCAFCDKRFRNTTLMRSHQLVHRNDGKALDCKLCNKKFSSYLAKVLHMKSHEAKRHKCDICGKTYSVRACLLKHMKAHEYSSSEVSENDLDERSELSERKNASVDERTDRTPEDELSLADLKKRLQTDRNRTLPFTLRARKV